LPAWLREGGAHEGTAVEPVVAAAAISPIDFARAQVNSAWQSVNLSGDARLSTWPTPEDLERLREVMRESSDSRMMVSLTLVIAEDDASYAAVERGAGKSVTRGLYYLSGGAPALLAFQRTQGALTNRPAELLQTRIAAPRPLMGSGCGTCPQR
jgi:hypothetical protein